MERDHPHHRARLARPTPLLNYYRKQSGLTQKQLAEKLDVPQSCISEAEARGTGISQAKWYRLAQILDCDAQVLQGYKPIPQAPLANSEDDSSLLP